MEELSASYQQTALSIQTHSFSGRQLFQYPEVVKAILLVKKAAAFCNAKAGTISEQQATIIGQACDRLCKTTSASIFAADVYQGGGSIGIHMNILEAILHQCPKEQMDLKVLNASQSTADVCSTAFHIAIIELFFLFEEVCLETIRLLQTKANVFEKVPITALTCMQDALPSTLDTLFASYASVVERRLKNLKQAAQFLYQVNIGGTVIGSGDGATKRYRKKIIQELNNLLPYHLKRRKNLYDAAQNIDDLAAFSAQLTLLCQSLIKMGKDLRLLSSGPSAGMGVLQFPKIIKGSSFFGEKNNPTVIETLLIATFLVIGKDRSVQAATEHGELHLNIFENTAAFAIYESLDLLSKALHNFNQYCLKGIESIRVVSK